MITVFILFFTVFVLGFVADPILRLWVDPFGSVVGSIFDLDDEEDDGFYVPPLVDDDEPGSWAYHFFKGFASLGLLGFVKSFLVMSPWHWFNVRIGGGRARRRGGRERVDSLNWIVVVIGIFTFLAVGWIIPLMLLRDTNKPVGYVEICRPSHFNGP